MFNQTYNIPRFTRNTDNFVSHRPVSSWWSEAVLFTVKNGEYFDKNGNRLAKCWCHEFGQIDSDFDSKNPLFKIKVPNRSQHENKLVWMTLLLSYPKK